MQKKDFNYFSKELEKLFPNAKTELYYENEFQLLIAILMSAQTTDKQVNIVNKIFFNHLKIPKAGKNMKLEDIKFYIKKISFFSKNAQYIKESSKILYEKYNSKIPKKIKQLMLLPGVGVKTAKVFLSITQNAPYIGVDTHVHRVLNRVGFVNTKNPLQTDKKLEKILKNKKIDFNNMHHTLILFGRYICKSRKAKCIECFFNKKCPSKQS